MKWIKNGNQLINMAHVSTVKILVAHDKLSIYFLNPDNRHIDSLQYDNLETAEAHLEAIAMFLEHQHAVIMAMAPTNEEAL